MRDQRKDQWIEQYEEAALGLLMEEYADSEGALLLQEFEEASQEGSVEPMPEELTAKCLKSIDQAYTKCRSRKLFSGVAKVVGKIAVFAMVFLGVTSITILSVDAWRVPVLNFILDESGNSASIFLGNTATQTTNKFEEIAGQASLFVPYGYELVNQPSTDGSILSMRFKNAQGNRILITVCSSSSELVVDTENAECTEMEIAGHRAFLIQKGSLHIIWLDEAAQLYYEVYSNGLSADEFWELVYALTE